MNEFTSGDPQGSLSDSELGDLLQRAIHDMEADVEPSTPDQAGTSPMMASLSAPPQSNENIPPHEWHDSVHGPSATTLQASQHETNLLLENYGLVGFFSMDEVQDYADRSRIGEITPLVAIVDLHTQDNAEYVADGGPECWLVVPTMTRGKALVTLQLNSPIKREVFEHVAWKSRRDAIMELNGEYVRQSTFAESWLGRGGKFDIRNCDAAIYLHPNTSGDGSMMKVVDLTGPAIQNQEIDMPYAPAGLQVPHNVDATPINNKQIVIFYHDVADVAPLQEAQNGPGDSGSNPVAAAKSKEGPANQGFLRRRLVHAPGAIRIWQENAITPPGGPAETHPVFSLAPPAAVDLRLLGDVYITARELLIWFPDHMFKWSDYAERVAAAGCLPSTAFKFIYHVRGRLLIVHQALTATTLRLIRNDLCRFHRFYRWVKPASASPPFQDLTCGSWKVPPHDTIWDAANYLMDYYVSDLAHGVSRDMFPTGEDAGPLTAVIQHVLDNPYDRDIQALKLSDVAAFAKHINVFRSGTQAGDPVPDQKHVDIDSFARMKDLDFPALGASGSRKSARNNDEDSDMED